jgi:hypothetical protein
MVMEDLATRFTIDKRVKLSQWVLSPKTLPSICFTSKGIWQEAVLAYIRRTRFILESRTAQDQLDIWLSRKFSDSQGFKAVRMLSYYGSSYSMFSLIERAVVPGLPNRPPFVGRCHGLRHLILEVRSMYLLGDREDDVAVSAAGGIPGSPFGIRGFNRPIMTVNELKNRYNFKALFGCKNLRFIKMICIDYDIYIRRYSRHGQVVSTKEDLFENFVTLIREGFQRRGRVVDICIEYEDDPWGNF